jgi:RNA polymerase sigma factor (sigma-70 family)
MHSLDVDTSLFAPYRERVDRIYGFMVKPYLLAEPTTGRLSESAYAGDVPPEAGEPTLTELVELARGGDEDAWRTLVARVKNLVWKTVNGFRLGRGDAEDAFAATFFRLAEHIDTIREPERLPGWVATTARNESLALIKRNRRALALDPTDNWTPADHAEHIVESELKQAIHESFKQLSDLCQQLLRLLTADPPLSYEQVASVLDMPMGSIGPNRQRCLERLRANRPMRPFMTETTR